MMKSNSKDTAIRRIRPIALGVAIASMLPMAAQAAVIELYAESSYSMGGVSAPPLVDGPRAAGYVDVLAFQNDSNNNSIGLHSYGSDAGDFGSRSSGAGIYDVSGLFRIRESLTNNTGAAAVASFNFNITPGILSNEIRSTFLNSEFVEAHLSFEIVATRSSVGTPVTVWSSNASLISNATVVGQFSASGTDTSFYVRNSLDSASVYYDVESFSKTLDLGLLNPGESIEIKYEIKSSAKGNSTAGGTVDVPLETVTIPGHWEWTRDFFSTETTPGNAINGLCYGGYGGYGEFNTLAARIVEGDPNIPPTDSPCWVWYPPNEVTVGGYTETFEEPSGSQASSGDPFNFNVAGYYTGILPLQGGLTLADASVPEPGALALLGLGLMAGWLSRRRQS